MPEIGSTKLATSFSEMMADVRRSMDKAQQVVGLAVRELQTEVETGAVEAAKAIADETRNVREGYAQILGNRRAGDETDKDVVKKTTNGAGTNGVGTTTGA